MEFLEGPEHTHEDVIAPNDQRSRGLTESTDAVLALEPAEADALRQLGLRLASKKAWWGDDPEAAGHGASVIRVRSVGDGRWSVRVRDAVGLVSIGSLQLLVEPKIPTSQGSQTLVLDHYLEILARKPGALPGALATHQAREQGVLTAAHEAFWARARRRSGDSGGTRALIEVLLPRRRPPFPAVHAALEAVNGAGSADPDLVAIEARRIAEGRGPTGSTAPSAGHLRRYDRSAPVLTDATERRPSTAERDLAAQALRSSRAAPLVPAGP